MKLLARVAAVLDRTNDLFAIMACVLLTFMMLSVSAEVVMRYLFNRPLGWVVEISEISLLYITFLGVAWLLKRERHVKMDILVTRLKPRVQALLNVFGSIIGVAVCWVLTWYGAQVTWSHFQRGLFEPTILEIPNVYVLWVIPVGSFLFFTQFLRRTYSYLRIWRAS